jgi:hypothetical protein
MANKESPNASYSDRPQSRQNSGSRSYSEMVETLTLRSPEAQNALEELERASLKVLNDKVKVRSRKDSPFSRACFYLEEVFPEMLMNEEEGPAKAEAIYAEAKEVLKTATEFLESEQARVDKLLADGYVDLTLAVKHERQYEVSSSSVLYRDLVSLVELMDKILLSADKLRFASLFTVIQRKTIARELHRTVMKAGNRLTSMEGLLHKKLVRRTDDADEKSDETNPEAASADDSVAEKAQDIPAVATA